MGLSCRKPEPSAPPGAVQEQKQRLRSCSSEASGPCTRAVGFSSTCQCYSFTISVEGFPSDGTDGSNPGAVFGPHFLWGGCVQTLVSVESGKRLHFHPVQQLEEQELEESRRQAECQKMLPPHGMDPTRELRPQEAVSNPSAPAETEMHRLPLYFARFLWLM